MIDESKMQGNIMKSSLIILSILTSFSVSATDVQDRYENQDFTPIADVSIGKEPTKDFEKLSQGQQAHINGLYENYDKSVKMCNGTASCVNNLDRGLALEVKQISRLSKEQFDAFKEYNEKQPTSMYIAEGATSVLNPNYDPCYEIRNNTSGANTPENMAACSGQAVPQQTSTAAAAKNEVNVLSEQLQYIELGKQSQFEILVEATKKYEAGQMSVTEYALIAQKVSKVVDASNKIIAAGLSNSSNSNTGGVKKVKGVGREPLLPPKSVQFSNKFVANN